MPLQIIRQDITKMKVDAIVNTTNEEMVGFSGVDLAIHTIAGAELDAECAKLAPLGLGQAKISGAYGLPCKYVIHTSGPIWRGGLLGESIILRSCYIESLKIAAEQDFKTIAFPLISSGAYGYPKDQVLKFAVQTITEFLFDHELTVYLCVFDKESYSFSQKLFADIQSFIDNGKPGNLQPAPSWGWVSSLMPRKMPSKSLQDYLKEKNEGFADMLFRLIDERGMTDVECYKKANVDKRTFSKIKSNKDYKPSKQTVIAVAVSLQLDLEQTQELLATAGFALSNSKVFDKIIRYFILNKTYDVFKINEALFEFNQKHLGSF